MLTKQRFTLYCMNLVFDSLFLFLLFVLIFKGAALQDLGLFVLLMFPVIAVSGTLFIFKPTQLKLNLACTVILAALLFWGLTSYLLFSIFFALIVTWRTAVNWEDPLKSDTEAILTISALFAVCLSLFLKEGYGVMYGAIWLQLIFMLGMKMYQHYLKTGSHEKKKKMLLRDYSVPIALIGLSIIMFVILKPLKSLVLIFQDGLLFLLYYIVAVPLWYVFSSLKYVVALFTDEEEKKKKKESLEAVEEIFEQKEHDLNLIDFTFLFWSTIALLVLIIGIYVWRKRLWMNLKPDAILTGNVSVITSAELHGPSFKSRRWLQTKDRTRKKFAHFEKSMDKRGFARMPGESAQLWFERLKLNGEDAESVLNAYERVRYGDKSLSNDEYNDYVKTVKKLENSKHLQKKKSN